MYRSAAQLLPSNETSSSPKQTWQHSCAPYQGYRRPKVHSGVRSRAPLACSAQFSRGPRGSPAATESDPWRQTSSYDFPPPPSQQYPPGPPPQEPKKEGMSGLTKALIASSFILGVGAGAYLDAEITLSPTNVASTELVDRRTPNSEICMAYGYSAMAFDQRLFVSFNPFNVYVTQPEVKPGCILRRSNVNILENKKLVTNEQVEFCRRGMNTFAFVGDLADSPQVSCVYHSEEAENQYLLNPKKLVPVSPSAEGSGQ